MDSRVAAAKAVGAGLATCSLIGAGISAGTIFGSLISSTARNFIKKETLFQYTILGFALTEAVGLLGLMMAFLILFL